MGSPPQRSDPADPSEGSDPTASNLHTLNTLKGLKRLNTLNAVVRTSVVESWPRVTSKRINADLQAVAQGTFKFSDLEHLLAIPGQDVAKDE